MIALFSPNPEKFISNYLFFTYFISNPCAIFLHPCQSIYFELSFWGVKDEIWQFFYLRYLWHQLQPAIDCQG